jgi:UDP-2,3-diacylglucosamine hydrolase
MELEPLSWPLVVASDIHLRAPDDERALLLESVLDRCLQGQVDHFVLLGDIFDFCFGGSQWFRNKFVRLGAKLEALAASGTQVVFVEGNHEFDMASMGWKGVHIHRPFDLAINLKAGPRVRFCHGDLLHAPKLYRLFRAIIKSPVAILGARAVPGHMFDAWSLNFAAHSRSKDEYRSLDHEALMRAANAWLDRTDAEFGVFGHFHVPYAEPRLAGRGRIFSLDSWDKPNLLVFGRGDFRRIFLAHAGKNEVVVAPEPVLLR